MSLYLSGIFNSIKLFTIGFNSSNLLNKSLDFELLYIFVLNKS